MGRLFAHGRRALGQLEWALDDTDDGAEAYNRRASVDPANADGNITGFDAAMDEFVRSRWRQYSTRMGRPLERPRRKAPGA